LGIVSLCDYLGISYEICDDTNPPTSYDDYEAIIPSPGVPSYHAIYEIGKVISELDFACKYLPSGFQTIAVTGTDGKSTTSWILFSILQKEYFGKKSIYLSGNFDIPFSATLTEILKK
jgi:UDP-N-acetylmuramoylalanine--D-glutamate ligase